MSGMPKGSVLAGNASAAVLEGRRGSRLHVPIGVISRALREPPALFRRTPTSPAAFTAVDLTDVPVPMASGVATLHGSPPLCQSTTRALRPPLLASASTVVAAASDCTLSTVVADPGASRPV